MILSYVEAIIPINLVIPFPGFKLGLANIAVAVAFFTLGYSYAVAVSLCRIGLTALLFGSITSFYFSVFGGVLTLLTLLSYKFFFYRTNGIIGLSVASAAMHNLGQCIACATLFGSYVLPFYLPYLLIFSLITGSVTALLVHQLLKLKFLYSKDLAK
jgi:heptaprenyl diphosphate synthase